MKEEEFDLIDFESVPKTKPATSTRGRLKTWENGAALFAPEKQGSSSRTQLGKAKNSSYFATAKGYGAQLFTPNDDPDPVATLTEQFLEATKKFRKNDNTSKLARGKQIHDSEELKVFLNKTQGKLVGVITLDCDLMINQQLAGVNASFYSVVSRFYKDIVAAKKKGK